MSLAIALVSALTRMPWQKAPAPPPPPPPEVPLAVTFAVCLVCYGIPCFFYYLLLVSPSAKRLART